MKTYWNGTECKATKVQVIVGPSLRPTWWCADLEGKEYPAIRIEQGGDLFYIADDERSWDKITKGKGSFMFGHKSLPVEREL